MTECNLLPRREMFRKTGKKLSNNVKLYCMQKKEKRNTKKKHKESSKSESLELEQIWILNSSLDLVMSLILITC